MSLDLINGSELCKAVLMRLGSMGDEYSCNSSAEQLIFPMKVQNKGEKQIVRRSEQELRVLFIDEFKKENPDFYYSIETPTEYKYIFSDPCGKMMQNSEGQSALIDLCIFERCKEKYSRILNIEFKHKNTASKNIEKDILKLISERSDGLYIHLLDTSDSGTFCNKTNTGVFNKLNNAFIEFQSNWIQEKKIIQVIILSLEQRALRCRRIKKNDMQKLKDIFFIESGCGNIYEIKGNGWEVIDL